MMKYSPIALVVAQLLAPAAYAQDENKDEQHQHENTEVIVINASPLARTELNSAQPVSVISGDELREKQAHTLGETLAHEPGINSTHFARVASSPIIRGLDGPRVKVTQNGLDSADVSRGSPDHAVTTETSVAQQIEILRGPATLLYGSGAIGGVVNVVDERIAQEHVGGTRGFFGGNLASVDDLRDVNAGVSTDIGNTVLHVDGFARSSDDYQVPSFTNDEGETTDTIENSFVDAQGGTLGLSYLFDGGFIGASYARLDQEYGIPGHHAHEEEHGEEEHSDEPHEEEAHEEETGPFADLKQNRWQLHAGLENPWQGVEQLSVRYAYTDYQHQEIEDAAPSTTFTNEQHELRVTANHQLTDQWYGAFGYHGFLQEQAAFGEEAYTPASETDRHGLFWLIETRENKLNYQLGVRYENVSINAPTVELGRQQHDFDPLSASFGVTYQWHPAVMFNANYSFAQRAPSANEIFANGAHLATQTYELGLNYDVHAEAEHLYVIEPNERSIELETSHSLDLGAHFETGENHLNINLFVNRVNNFVYESFTGLNSVDLAFDHDDHADEEVHEGEPEGEHDHEEGLPVVQYNQEDVVLFGYEIDGRWQLAPNWRLDAFSDYTRAYAIDNNANLPRIPSQRIGAEFTYNEGNWESSLGYVWYAEQNRVAANEERTPSYGLLNAQFNWFPQGFSRYNLSVYVKAENLTDKLGYVHTSFLKYDAPVAGRNFSIGLRGEF
ncbi:TonB-dependent receptor [Pseudidiomarina homiensis]|nr:TonB-dependent receptor [Pseudidiomarina homiensis]